MSQETPSLQVRCSGCNTSFKMKLKRGRIPTKVVPCPKCKSAIDLSQYTDADIQTGQPMSGIAKRLRPAAELLKTIIPQARIFDRSRNRKKKIEGPPKAGPGFHLQKGGTNEKVSLPENGYTFDRPSGLVVGRMTTPEDPQEPEDLRQTPAMGLESARALMQPEKPKNLLDSGVLTKTQESGEIDVGLIKPHHTPVPSLTSDSDADFLTDFLTDLDSDVFDAAATPPTPALPQPSQMVAEHIAKAELPLPVSKAELPKTELPKLEAPKIQAPKKGPADFKPPPKAPSFKLPAPISGLSESSEPREDKSTDSKVEVSDLLLREDKSTESKVEVSDLLREAVEKQRFETTIPEQEQSLEMIRNAEFSSELEREQADSFFKSSVEVAESLEFEVEEFDLQQESRAPFSMLVGIILLLMVFAAIVGFLILT